MATAEPTAAADALSNLAIAPSLPYDLALPILAALDDQYDDRLIRLDDDFRLPEAALRSEQQRRSLLLTFARGSRATSAIAAPRLSRRVFVDSWRGLVALRSALTARPELGAGARVLIVTGIDAGETRAWYQASWRPARAREALFAVVNRMPSLVTLIVDSALKADDGYEERLPETLRALSARMAFFGHLKPAPELRHAAIETSGSQSVDLTVSRLLDRLETVQIGPRFRYYNMPLLPQCLRELDIFVSYASADQEAWVNDIAGLYDRTTPGDFRRILLTRPGRLERLVVRCPLALAGQLFRLPLPSIQVLDIVVRSHELVDVDDRSAAAAIDDLALALQDMHSAARVHTVRLVSPALAFSTRFGAMRRGFMRSGIDFRIVDVVP